MQMKLGPARRLNPTFSGPKQPMGEAGPRMCGMTRCYFLHLVALGRKLENSNTGIFSKRLSWKRGLFSQNFSFWKLCHEKGLNYPIFSHSLIPNCHFRRPRWPILPWAPTPNRFFFLRESRFYPLPLWTCVACREGGGCCFSFSFFPPKYFTKDS